ncbi:MAG: aspartate 1-decarboxylase [Pirellulaceae bacterium]
MLRTLLRSKIHRVTVTEANLDYDGSISIDVELLEAAGITDHEQVDIYNVTRGTRITTYAIEAERGSRRICINGAAAHLVDPGDLVIIACYGQFSADEIQGHEPVIIHVDAENNPTN